VTAPGARSISRSSASLLASAGLADWIAPSPQGYADLAVQKASDPRALAALRTGLRETVRRSPLMDEAAFTRSLESAYRAMWRRWCK
jgi:predicted O-linked N-acetylglucosamine transferase (SPINDLY family)